MFAITPLESCFRCFPNMRTLHPDTKVEIYREYNKNMDAIEITVFYREPGEEKMRIDAEARFIDERVELSLEDIKIIRWGLVTEGVGK